MTNKKSTNLFPRNILIHDKDGSNIRGTELIGEWVVVPKKDFDDARKNYKELLRVTKIALKAFCSTRSCLMREGIKLAITYIEDCAPVTAIRVLKDTLGPQPED